MFLVQTATDGRGGFRSVCDSVGTGCVGLVPIVYIHSRLIANLPMLMGKAGAQALLKHRITFWPCVGGIKVGNINIIVGALFLNSQQFVPNAIT